MLSLDIALNQLELRDSLIDFNSVTNSSNFYSVENKVSIVAKTSNFFSTQLQLTPFGHKHIRKLYSLFDLLTDLGGVAELLVILFGIIIFPFSEFSFNIKAIQKLFYVRTRNDDFIMLCDRHTDNNMNESMNLPKDSVKEINLHKTIKLKNRDMCRLFFQRGLSSCCKAVLQKSRLTSMYEQGQEKLNENLDIIRVVEKLNQYEILMMNTQMISQQTKYLIDHARQNQIYLESEENEQLDTHNLKSDSGLIVSSDDSIEEPREFESYKNSKKTSTETKAHSRSRVWEKKFTDYKKQPSLKFALTQSRIWANLAENVKQPPHIVEKKLKAMTDKDKETFVVNGFTKKKENVTIKSRFKGMTFKQKETWAKTTIGIHVREWKIRRNKRKMMNNQIQDTSTLKTDASMIFDKTQNGGLSLSLSRNNNYA